MNLSQDQLTGTLSELAELATKVRAAIDELLEHSAVVYNDVNADGSGLHIVGWNPYRWTPLEAPGQAALARAQKRASQWRELSRLAIEWSAPRRLRTFDKHDRVLDQVLDRDTQRAAGVPGRSIDGARQAATHALNAQLELLTSLPSAYGPGGRLLVPDTNALLYKPQLEEWRLGAGRWTLVFVPQVIRELDAHKMRDRLAESATAVIRRLKEYGRRGDTFEGVRLKGDVWVREVAIDPDLDKAPGWLRRGHADDELLASVLELKWQDLRAEVRLVTRDRNLQNKARLARVSYLDAEDL